MRDLRSLAFSRSHSAAECRPLSRIHLSRGSPPTFCTTLRLPSRFQPGSFLSSPAQVLKVCSLGPAGSPNAGHVTLIRPSTGHLRAYGARTQFFQEPGTDLPFPEGKSQGPYNDPPKAVHDPHPLTSLTSTPRPSLSPLWPPQIPVVAISRTFQALSGCRALVQTVPSAGKCFLTASAWLSPLPPPRLLKRSPPQGLP